MKKLFLNLLVILCAFTVNAQLPENISRLISDGSAKITASAETDHDYWVGTTAGVYRISKKNNKVKHLEVDNSVMPSNNVTALCVKSDGVVFVGTDRGIMKYDNYSYLLMNTENANIGSNSITALAVDKYQRLWIGTKNGGVTMYDRLLSRHYTTKNSILNSNAVTAFESNTSAQVVICLESGQKLSYKDSNLEEVNFEGDANAMTYRK